MLLLLAFAIATQAQTYNFLTFTETDGTKSSIPAAGTVITFNGGTLNAMTQNKVAHTYSLSNLVSMRFTETATSIAELQTATFATDNVQVYDTAGRLLRNYNGETDAALQGLKAAGIYIIKANGKTQKRTVK